MVPLEDDNSCNIYRKILYTLRASFCSFSEGKIPEGTTEREMSVTFKFIYNNKQLKERCGKIGKKKKSVERIIN